MLLYFIGEQDGLVLCTNASKIATVEQSIAVLFHGRLKENRHKETIRFKAERILFRNEFLLFEVAAVRTDHDGEFAWLVDVLK